ncbi:copper radical oxidase [Zopfia rhizophila CBS 207.26]|uniref:Copper radical oxidase n=1 Tax=Zopfia rhizophila CBS 207.26 TaxID=1314779 RepID=A0A6A6DJF5_9PEZI|nr:copper radical oxidase [Zopfia rhizophila CBS 207.26]
MAKDQIGEWGDVFDLKTVAVHASLLPNGKVLYWGRRTDPKDDKNEKSLNEHSTKAFIWDPAASREKKDIDVANKPTASTGEEVNLFCSGHCFQPDGRLLVVGGHNVDGWGIDQASIYDPSTNTWSAKKPMNDGRWYPSALTLPDGRILSVSGGGKKGDQNVNPQIWRTNTVGTNAISTDTLGTWDTAPQSPKLIQFLYPRLHVYPNGGVFVTGPGPQSSFLRVDPTGSVGKWTEDGPMRTAGQCEYGASVMYDSGKIMYIGGGGGDFTAPTNVVEFIDLTVELREKPEKPQWTTSNDTNMDHARRQHNATLLPDGTVLVTGGTKGIGFNNVDEAVHEPELWNPSTKKWTKMAHESVDRCYHSIALLLPDGRVLSAGGGEWAPKELGGKPNRAKDSLINAQLFKPPYLFKGPQPTTSNAPPEITYNQKFEVIVGASDSIREVDGFLQQPLPQKGSKVTVQAPANENFAPPGHYMLFVLNQQGVPSVARIVHIFKDVSNQGSVSGQPQPGPRLARRAAVEQHIPVHLPTLNQNIITEQNRPDTVVGITPSCPYGLGACWGGAFEALQAISEIEVVRPLPNKADSLAYVYLRQDIVPDIDVWAKHFQETTNGSHILRGLEMTLSGVVTKKQLGADQQLTLASTPTRPELVLAPFQETSKIEWDLLKNAPKPVSEAETGAYAQLSAAVAEHPEGVELQVTGRLRKHDANGFFLEVRGLKVDNPAAAAPTA